MSSGTKLSRENCRDLRTGARVGAMADGRPATGRPALGDVIASLGPEVLRTVHLPRGRAAGVSDVLLFDATDPQSVRANAIVLALGLSATAGDAFALVDSAGRQGAAAVVLRMDGELPERLVAVAEAL